MTDYNKTKCPICGKLLGERRLTRYPGAITCGWAACAAKHRRNRHNVARRRYYAKRYANDPGFRAKELEHGRAQYLKKQLAAGKKVNPRARIATNRGPIDTYLAAIRRRASEALAGAARAVRSICG